MNSGHSPKDRTRSRAMVKPFEGQGDFTVMRNLILDRIMPVISPAAWKVLCFIIRKTIGWQKVSDRLSYTQIAKGTGIKSSATISKALQQLIKKQIIVATPGDKWDKVTYRLNLALEIEARGSSLNEAASALDYEAEVASTPEAKAENLALDSKDTKNSVSKKTGTHLQTAASRPTLFDEQPRAQVGVRVSPDLTKDDYKRFARATPTFTNPDAWVNTHWPLRDSDDLVLEWLERQKPERIEETRAAPENNNLSYGQALDRVRSLMGFSLTVNVRKVIDELPVDEDVRKRLIEKFCGEKFQGMEVADGAGKSQEPDFERAEISA